MYNSVANSREMKYAIKFNPSCSSSITSWGRLNQDFLYFIVIKDQNLDQVQLWAQTFCLCCPPELHMIYTTFTFPSYFLLLQIQKVQSIRAEWFQSLEQHKPNSHNETQMRITVTICFFGILLRMSWCDSNVEYLNGLRTALDAFYVDSPIYQC